MHVYTAYLANSLFFPPVSIHFLTDLFSLLHLITPASDCAGGTFSTRPTSFFNVKELRVTCTHTQRVCSAEFSYTKEFSLYTMTQRGVFECL